MLKYAAILMLGILLCGCVNNQPNYNMTNNTNYNVTNNTNVNNNTNVQPGAFDISVPSELPIAYVGKPYFYSFCDPQPAPMDPGSTEYVCGNNNVTSKNPTGGTGPYWITEESQTKWYVNGITYNSNGMLNFTPKSGDEGQYVLQVCARDSSGNGNEVCKNTTIYIMSDTVTVKGEGELTHYLLLKLNSNVKTADFAGTSVEKSINTSHYVPAASFSFTKVTSEVPSRLSCNTGAHCGGGSYAAQDFTATDTSVSDIADGNAACGDALGPGFPGEYNVDYYHVGYVGYADNTYLALNITNTGTKDKAIDVYLNASSELDPGSQNYFSAVADAVACIGSDNCVSVPTGARGAEMVNSTVLRVLVRPGSHWIYVGSMDDNFANTNMVTCPSFVKASSEVSITIVPADMSDGKKAIGSIYSNPDGSSDVKVA